MLLKMAGLCAGAEQCSADIRGKVLRKGFPADVADRIVCYLVSHGYVDDARYARAFASDKVRFAGWGRIKVRMHLKAKHLPDDIVRQGLDYISGEDYAKALEKVLAAKARGLDLSDVECRRRLYRSMASRGFEASLVIAAIRKYMAGNGTD